MKALNSLRALPHLAVWIGVGLLTAGVALLFVAWAETASRTNVAFQIPYVISAGFGGLGFIVLGLTTLNLAAKREQTRDRDRQAAEMRALLADLRRAVDVVKAGK